MDQQEVPPGISVLLGGSPQAAAVQMRHAFPKSRKWNQAAQQVGTATVAAIRQAGFEIVPDPTSRFANQRACFTRKELLALPRTIWTSWPNASKIRRGANMQPSAEPVFYLVDAQDCPIGEITVENREGNLLLGRFVPGPAYTAVENLFRAFEEAVNSQALKLVDELDVAIAALKLQLGSSDGKERFELSDVQIWSDGGFSCRLANPALLTRNGAVQSTQQAPTVR
jgi:hypothetical protein